ncbi:MAG: CAP domain-containing protein [Polyangiaceae bacterium]
MDPRFVDACPAWDAALGRVAMELAEGAANSRSAVPGDRVQAKLLEQGAPYVWPRTWTVSGGARLERELGSRLSSWLAAQPNEGPRRCGGAVVRGPNGRIGAAVVLVEALAELSPIPANVRLGSWVEVQAQLLVPHAGAKVIALGPRGRPQPLPTALDGGRVRARFAADREGPWLLQVVADMEGGPRQVLEALLIAGTGPRSAEVGTAPGENSTSSDAAGLLSMLNAARESERLRPLAARLELDELAADQAEALRAAQRLAHDLGNGDPESRVQAAGLTQTRIGENVAHADSLARAHRALWSSPSHRSNMLDDRFDSIGIGVAHDADGSVWVCELFARLAR